MSTNRQIITPYLSVANGNAALDWYRTYFRAAVSNVIECCASPIASSMAGKI